MNNKPNWKDSRESLPDNAKDSLQVAIDFYEAMLESTRADCRRLEEEADSFIMSPEKDMEYRVSRGIVAIKQSMIRNFLNTLKQL